MVTFTEAAPIVVVSVWVSVFAVGVLVSLTDTTIVPAWPGVAVAAVVPHTTKLKLAPTLIDTGAEIVAFESATPSWLISAK